MKEVKSKKTFEQGMNRLEEIVERLESENLELESAMALFTEGAELATSLDKMLAGAKLKVEKLFPSQEKIG